MRYKQNWCFPLTFWLIPPCHQRLPLLPFQPCLLFPFQITRDRRKELFTSRQLSAGSPERLSCKKLSTTFPQHVRWHIKFRLSLQVQLSCWLHRHQLCFLRGGMPTVLFSWKMDGALVCTPWTRCWNKLMVLMWKWVPEDSFFGKICVSVLAGLKLNEYSAGSGSNRCC